MHQLLLNMCVCNKTNRINLEEEKRNRKERNETYVIIFNI